MSVHLLYVVLLHTCNPNNITPTPNKVLYVFEHYIKHYLLLKLIILFSKNQQFLVYVSDSTHKYILSVNTPHQRDALITIHGPALGFTLDGVYSLSFDKYVMTCIPL